MNDDNRRKRERRNDPEAWTPAHRRNVRVLYGMVVGGVLVLLGAIVGAWAILNDRTELPVLGFSASLVILGLIAGAPSVFLPVFSALIKKIPWGRAAKNGDITRALPSLVKDELAELGEEVGDDG